MAFSTVLFGLDWFPVNLVFGLVPRLPMLPMLCRLARSLAFFREPLLFLSRTSLSCRTKMPCRDLHLKYLVPLTDPSFLPGMEIKNKTALGIYRRKFINTTHNPVTVEFANTSYKTIRRSFQIEG